MECIPKTLSELLRLIRFDERGLVAAVAQDARSREVLMVAWMNREALERTLETGEVTYWSRTRQGLWRKGESSGHTQSLVALHVDCDGDTLLLEVEQKGPACHTNRRTCFYRRAGAGGITVTQEPVSE
jgi:phosphoribosyl-AMP cyclohydrolase